MNRSATRLSYGLEIVEIALSQSTQEMKCTSKSFLIAIALLRLDLSSDGVFYYAFCRAVLF